MVYIVFVSNIEACADYNGNIVTVVFYVDFTLFSPFELFFCILSSKSFQAAPRASCPPFARKERNKKH